MSNNSSTICVHHFTNHGYCMFMSTSHNIFEFSFWSVIGSSQNLAEILHCYTYDIKYSETLLRKF
jgi:hypothetical protein